MKILCTFFAIVMVVGLGVGLFQYILPTDWRWLSEENTEGVVAVSVVCGILFLVLGDRID